MQRQDNWRNANPTARLFDYHPQPEMTDPAPIVRRRFRARRALFKLTRIAVIVYLALCVILYFLQDWIVFPAATHQGRPEAKILPERDNQVLNLETTGGDHVAALFAHALLPDGSPDPNAAQCPTLIYFYGNGGAIAWSMNEFDHFRRLDINVLMPDFVGFGMSTGKASEVTLYQTADAAYEFLKTRNDIDQTKIVSVGWSLGSAVAIDLASRKTVAGLMTFNAFTTMPEMAHQLLPWFPASRLVKYRFDNQHKIASIKCPVFICNGLLDTLVPPEMSDRLAKSAAGPVTRVTIKSADHNTIFIADPEDLYPALRIFLDQIRTPPGK